MSLLSNSWGILLQKLKFFTELLDGIPLVSRTDNPTVFDNEVIKYSGSPIRQYGMEHPFYYTEGAFFLWYTPSDLNFS
jgi:hypothetical protein